MMSSSSLITQRAMAAVRGAFIADAASMGTHWIYNPKEMVTTVTSVHEPEFRNPPKPSFYSSTEFMNHYEYGMLSPYGEQMLFVVEHVASMNVDGTAMSKAMLQWSKTFGGRKDHALTTFMENMEKSNDEVTDDSSKDGAGGKYPNCGADDDQAHFYMKIIPITAKYVGNNNNMNDNELLRNVIIGIKVHQNNNKAVAYGIIAARILQAVLLGAPSLRQALDTVHASIEQELTNLNTIDGVNVHISDDIIEEVTTSFETGKKEGTTTPKKTLDEVLLGVSHTKMKGQEDSPFYDLAGRSCAVPGSFIGPIAVLYKYATEIDDGDEGNNNTDAQSVYEAALRENILASGDTCSRAIYIGAVLAAAAAGTTTTTIPQDWYDKVENNTMNKVNAAVEKMFT